MRAVRSFPGPLSAALGLAAFLALRGPALVAEVPEHSAAGISHLQTAADATCARFWVGREPEIEEYLKNAEIVKMQEIGIGVTRPMRADLAAGGPVSRMAWKQIKPGMYTGYWESYKSEIAAYELNKFLRIDMIPPTVERRVRGELGAAIMWASPAKSFKDLGGPPTPPAQHAARWDRMIVRAKMFDNLIANKDPNLGNWLVDPDWDLILIDHTRSFTTMREMVHKMTRIDPDLWDRMKALDEASLTSVVGQWLTKSEIKGMLERRDRFQKLIDQMVAKDGPAVFLSREMTR
jgi:hypothetical protein